jgi:hypothetical protein
LKKTELFLAILIIILINSNVFSQRHPGIRDLINQLGINTYSYLLTANRPVYDVDADMPDKGKFEINAGFAFGKDIGEIPVTLSFGAGKNLDLFAGIDLYSQSYTYVGKKISGIGDSNLGMKFRFQNSRSFSHVFQALVKIPTASSETELGTGLADFHFGLAEEYTHKSFGYDLSVEMDFLHRRDFPPAGKYIPRIQRAVDSLKSTYDYTYEPAIVLSLGPSLDVSQKTILYTGFSFTRNMRLNYNTTLVYAGAGINFTKVFALSLGLSYGLQQAGSWNLSAGFNFVIN